MRDHPLPVSPHETPSVEAGEGACILCLGSQYLGVPLSVSYWLLALLIQYNEFYTSLLTVLQFQFIFFTTLTML